MKFLSFAGLGLFYMAVLPILFLYAWYTTNFTRAVIFLIIAFAIRGILNFLTKGLIMGPLLEKFGRERGYSVTQFRNT